MSYERYVIPTTGLFKVTITPTFHPYNKEKLLYTVLNVGGNEDKCVNLTIHPSYSQKSKEIILSWTEVLHKECTVDQQKVKGVKTIEMLNLAFTIAKEIAPYAEYILLNDRSFFECSTPDGIRKVSLPAYHIAFHDKTWYEDKFHATMMNSENYTLYKKYLQNMYKENMMPEDFDFGNAELRELLTPLYHTTKTWKDFFKSIEYTYPKDKCLLMYPWIESAIRIIFERTQLFAGEDWKIMLDKSPHIHYYEIDKSYVQQGGEQKYVPQTFAYNDVDYGKIMDWKLKKFLKKKTTRKAKRIAEKKKYTKSRKHTLTF